MKKILITGGTGSFGQAMVTRLLEDNSVEEIVIFSRDELKQHDMRQKFQQDRLRFIIGDVRNFDTVQSAMVGIDTVFHAAALKQVPTGEFFPLEMVRTNILGTQNILDAAEMYPGVKKVVLLSTDKAVYPINAMGMSKAMAEKLLLGKARHATSTVFCTVRYGNVMASRGSVIPLFIDKIKAGHALPITNPLMTRFLLSLEDAIDLVLFAIKNGEQGDLFVKKASAATVQDLAKALLHVFDSSSNIEIVGTRAGEKIHETLATQLELVHAQDFGDYFRIISDKDENHKDYFEQGKSEMITEDYTSENTRRLSIYETEKLLRSLPFVKQQLKK